MAARLGIKSRTFRSWTSGDRIPPRDQLLILAEQFGVTTDFLITGRSPSSEHLPATDRSMLGVPMSDFIQVRLVSRSTGGPVEDMGEIAFRVSWLRERTNSPGECRLVRIIRDDMEPTLCHGAMVLIDSHRQQPDGGIFAFRLDGDLMVRRLAAVGGMVSITADNRSYSSMAAARDRLDILGQAIWQGSTLPDQ